ncbi:hypothetical protein [Agromyces atrinae]|uniref:Uncharacterized protein n=1 Tax=Agromyces atrinae TaxID=592376 RepID=A0A852SKA4_9MICO|nr:hypothetical protein [Agromyces atrinae]NYD68681.1 hypothetical protein [Agromyces atrinae]
MTQQRGHSFDLDMAGDDPGEIEMMDPTEPAPLSFGESATLTPGL